MADRHSRRKPGMTVGQRMREFSRSVMRHYAPLPDASAPEPSHTPLTPTPPPVEAPDAGTQFVTSAPLPFDTPAAEQASPFLPPDERPVYAPDPPLPQYVVPSTPPAPVVQRTEQPARPAGDIAIGPDGRPLLHNGKPIPVDSDPTPPALLELIQRQRQRDAEVQRLKEERSEKLKAELPPAPEDSDAPRSSRIRRRGSADVDYIQTKALADKREPGDTAADPKPNVKSPREPEQQESPPLDDGGESNEDGADSPSIEVPTDSASPVTDPSGISTASNAPAIQRDFEAETPVPSIPFDNPIDAPLAEPAFMPHVSELELPYAAPEFPVANDAPPAPPIAIQRQPDTEVSSPSQTLDSVTHEPSSSKSAERLLSQDIPSLAAAPQVSTPPIQRQSDTDASAPPLPLTESNLTRQDGRPADTTSASDVPQASQALPLTVQREPAPEIAPSLPFDAPGDQRGLADEPQTPVMPAPKIPSVQREFEREVPAPTLPFDVPSVFNAPEISQSQVPNTPEAASETLVAATHASPTAVQRATDSAISAPDLQIDSRPVEQDAVRDAHPPQVTVNSDVTQAGAAPHAPVVQRQTESAPSDSVLPFGEPGVSDAFMLQPEQTVSSDASSFQRTVMSEPAQSLADAVPSAPVASVQREPEVTPSAPFMSPDAQQAEQPAALDRFQAASNLASPTPEPVDTPTAQPSVTVQRSTATEAPVPSLPFDATAGFLDIPGEPPHVASESTEVPVQSTVPALQRQVEPDIPAPSIPFDETIEQAVSEIERRQFTAADSPPTSSEVSQPPAAAIQRRVEPEPAAQPIPFDKALQLGPDAAQETSPHEPSIPAVQRQFEAAASAPTSSLDAPLPIPLEAADEAQRLNMPQPAAPEPATFAPESQNQLTAETPQATPPESQTVKTPDFSRPEVVSVPQPATEAATDSTAVPAIRRQTDIEMTASPLPFDQPQVTEELIGSYVDQPMLPDVSDAVQFSAAALPADSPVSVAPAIQREVEVGVTSSPLPFDVPPELSAAPQVLQSEAPESSEVAQAGIAHTLAAAPSVSPAVQRQIVENPPLPYEAPRAAALDGLKYGNHAEPPLAPGADRAATDVAAPAATSHSTLHRQSDASTPALSVPTPAHDVLPFDNLDAIAAQRMPDEQRAVPPQPATLPFDPIVTQMSGEVQRTAEPAPSEPFSTPDTMPAGASAESRMDVFQALVAAGMVSRPPGGSPMPSASSRAQPLLQRSPSREAYLANMAQRQESAGAVTGPIQRALSEESAPEVPTQGTNEDESPEIDVNQLASDVMRVLRGKLRSEHERLSKR